MSTIIESIEQRQLRKDIPRFKAGDTVRVHFQVIEGQRRRVQVFEGIVIKRQGSGARETFTVRKQSFGVGVERTFPVHSPKIEKIEVGAIGDVNRAKLYYLREKIGKKARVRELRQTPAQLAAARAESEANQAALDAADAEAEAEAAAEAAAAAEPEAEEAPAEPEAVAEAEPVAEESADAEAEDAPAEEPRRGGRGRARRGRDVRDRRTGCREGVAPPDWPCWRWSPAAAAGGSAAGSCARGGAGARARPRPDSGYDAEDVHCTGAASPWFRPVETDQFTCAVRLEDGGCDWFGVAVDRDRSKVIVRLAQRDAGCTLGF